MANIGAHVIASDEDGVESRRKLLRTATPYMTNQRSCECPSEGAPKQAASKPGLPKPQG